MVILSFLQIEMPVLTFWKSPDFCRFASVADGQRLSHCAYTQPSCEETYLPVVARHTTCDLQPRLQTAWRCSVGGAVLDGRVDCHGYHSIIRSSNTRVASGR